MPFPNRKQLTDHNGTTKGPLPFHWEELWENDWPSFSDFLNLSSMLALFVCLCWCTITVCPFVCAGQIYFSLCLKRRAGNKPNTSGVDGLTRTKKLQVKWQVGWSNTGGASFEEWSSVLSEFWYLTQEWKLLNNWCCCFGEPAVFSSTDCTKWLSFISRGLGSAQPSAGNIRALLSLSFILTFSFLHQESRCIRQDEFLTSCPLWNVPRRIKQRLKTRNEKSYLQIEWPK